MKKLTTTRKNDAVLITGAALRLGRRIAERMHEQGWTVLIHYNRSEAEAVDLVTRINDTGGSAYAIQADLQSPEGYLRLMQQLDSHKTNLRVLVNNAAIFAYDTVHEANYQTLLKHLTVNSISPILLAKEFAALTEGRRNTIIINLLDNKVITPNPDYFSYTVSKQALHCSTTLLAQAFRANPKVYGLAPSMLLESGPKTHGRVDELKKINVLNSQVGLDDAANAVLFLAQGTLLSGTTLTVDGGQFLLHLSRDVAYLEPEGLNNPW